MHDLATSSARSARLAPAPGVQRLLDSSNGFRCGFLKALSRTFLVAGVLLSAAATVRGEDPSWPQFRGAGGQGSVEVDRLPLHWSESENVTWKTLLPGRGWSSPVIGDGMIWVTTAIEIEAPPDVIKKREAERTDRQPIVVCERVDFLAIGIDLESGKIRHKVPLFSAEFPQVIHALNSYASPTPVLSGNRLYCHFGAFGTCCVDAREGRILWVNRDIEVKHENGPGSTPVLWHDKLIVHFDGIDKQFVVAFDANTGAVAWETVRSGTLRSNPQYRKAYATPLILAIRGKDTLISPGADWVYAYDPETGEERWKTSYGRLGFSNVARPVAGHGLVFVSTSFGATSLLAIRPLATEGKIEWEYTRQVPRVSSPVLLGDELFFVSDRGIATCLDAPSGKTRWVKRLGGNYSASPLAALGRIYFFSRKNDDGKCVTTVIESSRKFRRIAKNELDGSIFASPAAIEGALILRTDRALYRIEE